MKKKVSLRSFISHEFFKAALLPLLIIEITLLALYFYMNNYLLEKSISTLSDDRLSHLMEITHSESEIISEELKSVSSLSLLLQSETSRFFNHPEQFPLPVNPPEFGYAPNGVYYKLKDNNGCSLFYSNRTSIGEKEREKALKSEVLDPLYKRLNNSNENIVAVYLNTYDSMSRYYPFFENVYDQLPADMDIPRYNFYYLADKVNNPEKRSVWTEAYLDPMGMGWMMSCIVPIYKGDFLEGVAGIDITINNFIDNLIDLQLPWGAYAFLVDEKGTIMAMPPNVEKIFGLTELYEYKYEDKVKADTKKPESFNLLESILSEAKKPVSELMTSLKGAVSFPLNGKEYVMCQTTVLETGWKLMAIADHNEILKPIYQIEKKTKIAGYAAIGFMLLFYILFFIYLLFNTRRMSGRISSTIGALSNAIRRLGTGKYEVRMEPSQVVELDKLSSDFSSMADDLQVMHKNLETEVKQANEAKDIARKAEEKLKEHQGHLESIVQSRTLELKKANEDLRDDIIKRKQIEKKLNIEREQLLSIFDSIDEPIYICTPDTYDLLYVNEAFKKYWPVKTQGKCYEIIQNQKEPCSFCTNHIIFGEGKGKPYIWERENKRIDKWFRCIDKAIQWPDGRIVRYEMAIDITDIKNAAEEKQHLMSRLRRAEKMEALGTLAGGVAHDLNNVLGGIVSYPDLLLMDIPEDSPLKNPIETIKKSGEKAAAIVQDLLTLARRGISIMKPLNLNRIVETYLSSPEHAQILSYYPGVKIKVSLEDDLMDCKGSSVHLSKMVMNLISNAVEAMPDGGDIFIRSGNRYVDRPIEGYEEIKEGEYAVLEITDNGVGIDKKDMERIFEPFYTKKIMGRSGTGLGMAVVWGTVKDHNGYIEINSSPGMGTAFTIYLPVTREGIAAETSEVDIDKYRGNNETVLIVDDVDIQREIAERILGKLGYKAVSLSSGEEAVEYLQHNRVDLVILDMIMEPNMNGLETYKEIIKIHPGQKAVIASGYSETELVREAQRLGAGKYIKKPYTTHSLGAIIKEELGK